MQRLFKLHLGAQPPGGAVSGASGSGRAWPCPASAHLRELQKSCHLKQGLGSQRQNTLQPCRITSTSKELFQSKEAKAMDMDDNGEDAYMDLPDYQVFDPDKGPLEKRVQRTYLEAVADDKVDMRDTEYWFTTPPGNWKSKAQRVYFMKEDEEPLFPNPFHVSEEDGAESRIRFSELEEGRMVLGVITDVWLYHGVQVDIGAEFDGLIPCTEDQWDVAVDHIDVGMHVMVEIHKVRMPGLYRWPLQLKFTVKHLQDLMLHPDAYAAPVDHGWAVAQGWSPEDVAAVVGRTLHTPTYFVPLDEERMAEEIIDGYGTGRMPWRSSPSEPVEDYIDDPLENLEEVAWLHERTEEVDAAADSLLAP